MLPLKILWSAVLPDTSVNGCAGGGVDVLPPVALAVNVTVPLGQSVLSGPALAITPQPEVTVVVAVVVQPFESVTVTVYVPAARPVAVCVVCTGTVFQL
jgi:hypothetical protein